MPLRTDIHKVMVLGSGPIVIGQAAEFDYAGTQACRALREEGLEVVLVNSNPATIMTDKAMADKIYIEPMTAGAVGTASIFFLRFLRGATTPARRASRRPTSLASGRVITR